MEAFFTNKNYVVVPDTILEMMTSSYCGTLQQLMNINSMQRITTTNLLINSVKLGIPSELVSKVYNDHPETVIRIPANKYSYQNVFYIQESSNETELYNLLHVISIFNQLVSINLKIYCDENYISILKNYSNDHIHFVKKETHQVKELEADIIVTYGSGVIHFMKTGIPVIIIGPYGLGGWVTSVSFPFLLKSGLAGRAGGACEEYVPVEIVAHEILEIKNCKNLNSVLEANKKIAEKLPYKPLSSINTIIAEQSKLNSKMFDKNSRWHLQPSLASNILFESAGDSITLKRKYIHDTLCTIAREDRTFFQAINGKTNCVELCKISQMNEDDFWEMMYALNEKRIIIF